MISPTDATYIQTKQIMLGQTTILPDFKALADFIDKTFGVKTINIVYDTNDDGSPRLGVYFEFDSEVQCFKENNERWTLDSGKQKLIADTFKETIVAQGLAQKKGLLDFFLKNPGGKYLTDNVFVYYSAFEPIAKQEANRNITYAMAEQLKKELDCKDLWEISVGFASVTFFLYTDEQVKRYEKSEMRKIWTDAYFDLLAPYNEFGYFKRSEFQIYLDSKENFDNNYQSNWYYYYK